ncbi:MAG: helix-turn-helix domain-containing protein [Deltaproteobacteria bacterium]|nr:helix-turn-helix domain-containing protein [Deltaproteobacteria bacterium]
MKTVETKETILTLHLKGVAIREISRILNISRNTVKRVLRGKGNSPSQTSSPYEEIKPIILELFKPCRSNVVRISEILQEKYGCVIPYSSLTRIVRELGLRENKSKHRAGDYSFAPGEECQHDTSPHKLIIGEKKVKAQCAGLVLAYSRKLFIQYYPSFTRFEAKVFLTEAFRFMDGTCPRCIIDNTSVIVANGSGPDADISPEMERFGDIFGMKFVPHRIGDADRKAKIERNFFYVEKNFLPGRTFSDWHDLNEQATKWCIEKANQKPKRSLGMSPDAAYLMEKPYLNPLPPYIPPVYKSFYRVVDVAGYVAVDTNRYSVPERFLGKQVEVHKSWEHVTVFFKNQKIAQHQRIMDKHNTRVTAKGHHRPFSRYRAHNGPSKEEKTLTGQYDILDQYVRELKKRSSGRGVRRMRRLLDLKRTYPADAFKNAIEQAFYYGLYDLNRLEQMILKRVAGNFFNIEQDES